MQLLMMPFKCHLFRLIRKLYKRRQGSEFQTARTTKLELVEFGERRSSLLNRGIPTTSQEKDVNARLKKKPIAR
jgi:hypothetical protein